MKGVKFGNYHSYNDWGLILSSKEIKAPKPKKIEIEIEGSDGFLTTRNFSVVSNMKTVHCLSLSAK